MHAADKDIVLLIRNPRIMDELQSTLKLRQDVLIWGVAKTEFLVHKGEPSLVVVFRGDLPDVLLQVHLLCQIEHVSDVGSDRDLFVILQIPLASLDT